MLEAVYGINLIKPEEWEDPDRPPNAEELLDAYSRKLQDRMSLSRTFPQHHKYVGFSIQY